MDALTPVDLLQSFPLMLYVWSVIILMWGGVVGALFFRMSKKIGSCSRTVVRESDRYALWLIGAVNVLLIGFVVTFSAAPANCTSWIAVVNVFYTAHLLYISIDIARWWKSVKQCCKNKANATTSLAP